MFCNRMLLGIYGGSLWSSTVISSGPNGEAWSQAFYMGNWTHELKSYPCSVRCVKR